MMAPQVKKKRTELVTRDIHGQFPIYALSSNPLVGCCQTNSRFFQIFSGRPTFQGDERSGPARAMALASNRAEKTREGAETPVRLRGLLSQLHQGVARSCSRSLICGLLTVKKKRTEFAARDRHGNFLYIPSPVTLWWLVVKQILFFRKFLSIYGASRHLARPSRARTVSAGVNSRSFPSAGESYFVGRIATGSQTVPVSRRATGPDGRPGPPGRDPDDVAMTLPGRASAGETKLIARRTVA